MHLSVKYFMQQSEKEEQNWDLHFGTIKEWMDPSIGCQQLLLLQKESMLPGERIHHKDLTKTKPESD
jgi:hypothetical protein